MSITVRSQWKDNENNGNSDSNDVGPVFTSPKFKTDIPVIFGQYSLPSKLNHNSGTRDSFNLGPYFVYNKDTAVQPWFIKIPKSFSHGFQLSWANVHISNIISGYLRNLWQWPLTITMQSQCKKEKNNIKSYSNYLWPIYIPKISSAMIQIVSSQYSLLINMYFQCCNTTLNFISDPIDLRLTFVANF